MSKVTVAEKLSAIGNNMARVYDTGFEKGHDQGFEEGKQFGDYAQGFEEGKKAEYDAFWDAFQMAKRRSWENTFHGEGWNDNTFYPKNDIVVSGNAAGMFRFCAITDLESRLNECGVVLDTSKATSLNNTFAQSSLTTIPTVDATGCTANNALNGMFAGATSLKSIRCIKINSNVSATVADTFNNCPKLEDVFFEGEIGLNISFNLSTKLRETSIRSIIEHLSDTASGKTLTLSKTAVDNAFIFSWEGGNVPGTDETNPHWPQLRDSKPNLTITLV